MKQLPLFLLIIFLLVIIGNLAAQQNPLIRTEEWQKHSTEDRLLNCRETRFEYDEFGNEILRKGFVWSPKEAKQKLSYINQKEYSSDHNLLLTEKSEAHPITASSKNYSIKYIYFGGHHLASRNMVISYGERPDYKRDTYFNPMHYNVDSIVHSYYNNGKKEWIIFEKVEYLYEDRKEVITFLEYDFDTLQWNIKGKRELQKDENGKVISSWTNYTPYQPNVEEEKCISKYNSYNHKTRQVCYEKAYFVDTFTIISDVELHNTYDQEERLIKIGSTNKMYNLYTGELELDYEGRHKIFNYFCDGLLRSEQEEYKGVVEKELRYYYQFGDNCMDRKNEDVILEIYPNPIENQLFINSETLLSEDCYLTLTNINGQLIYSRTVGERVDYLNIALENLDAGIYFVTLYWAGQRTTRKIIKR